MVDVRDIPDTELANLSLTGSKDATRVIDRQRALIKALREALELSRDTITQLATEGRFIERTKQLSHEIKSKIDTILAQAKELDDG